MTLDFSYFIMLLYFISACLLLFVKQCCSYKTQHMSIDERHQLRDEARDMFYHAYRAYMENAYPADELMPLSCTGRYRGFTPNRGDIDDALGNFSLTLIDTLDTLVILGDLEEFDQAIKLVIDNVSFDNDVVVSVFETNIRVIGGLLSAHILAEYLQQHADVLHWYRGELLDMAKDVGFRLLPAFNTTTGVPYARVNLKFGLKSELESARETCTACAGSSILEMAALSRLTGEPIFEEKARKAMDVLWKMRHRSSDLMGTILNVHSGDWVRRDSGVGAGIDSYYEYCLKAYVLLGDEQYLNRFNRHYNAVMKYISQGPMLLDVHMHRPHTNSRNYMDALLAFWPGLQVLKGDIKPAVETHEMLYQVMQRYKFIPEAFTTDFQVHWGNHPLRPEFLESTYFLYMATHDPYYLEVGKNVLKKLQKYARVPCGYAAVNDVHTGKQEDRMDSFVLSETFKYLYLLFADPEDLLINLDEFVFTTEGHLLPLTLGTHSNMSLYSHDEDLDDSEFARICPNIQQLFPESFRKPLKNMVDGVCPHRQSKSKLTAREFSASNINHLEIIKDMGIHVASLNNNNVQLLHSFSLAKTPAHAEEGILFMQEIVELAKQQTESKTSLQAVSFGLEDKNGILRKIILPAGSAQFGVNFQNDEKVTAGVVLVQPSNACEDTAYPTKLKNNIALVLRGGCMFIQKARRMQNAGAIGVIILDRTFGTSSESSGAFSMSGDGINDVNIPVVFLFEEEATKLLLSVSPSLEVTISEFKNKQEPWPEVDSLFQKLKVSVQQFLNKHTGIGSPETVSFAEFKAKIGVDRVRITYNNQLDLKNDAVVQDEEPLKWVEIRRAFIKILTENNELFVPLTTLRICYQTLSGESVEELAKNDVVKQTQWLMKELSIQHAKEKGESDGLIEVKDISEYAKKVILLQSQKDLETLSSIAEKISEIQTNVINEIKNSKLDDDNLVITSDHKTSDKVIITTKQLESTNKHKKDEL